MKINFSVLNSIQENAPHENLLLTAISFAFLISIAMLARVLDLANVGVDLTDEGYYFNWISNPWLYQYYASQFGYIYHPIYKVLGNSIVHLRQANMVISFGLSWLLSYFVLKQTLQNASKTLLIVASASLALPALYILMITGLWVPSPSYNSLNFQGCLIVALGFVFAINQNTNQKIIAGILIGLGGWLVFMAKPSTALLLAVVSVIYYLPTIKKDWRILLIAGSVAILLLLLSAFLIDGSILQFIERYQVGLQFMSAMGGGHGLANLFKLDFFTLSTWFKFKIILLTALLFFGVKLTNSNKSKLNIAFAIVLLIIIGACFNQVLNPSFVSEKVNKYHTLIITALTLASLLLFFLGQRTKQGLISNKLILLFLILPYLFAAGTSNNYWQTAAGASVFWVLATVLLLARTTPNLQIPCLPTLSLVVCFVVGVSVLGVFDSMRAPYRQTDAILKQTATYIDPHTQQTLVLSNDTAKYLNTLKKVLQKANFKPNTPVIDLTGHHPGTLYFMKAKAIGQAWTIGGYDGSYRLASMALYQASCEEIASAWLLIEKDGRRRIFEKVLTEHGLNPSKLTYQKVDKFETQTLRDWGSISKTHPDGIYMHYLLKPVDVENQTKACLAYHKTHSSPFK